MSYSKLFFGKEIFELSYDDIENYFIEERSESDKIEFKSYYNQDERNDTEKLHGVVRTICGLLNSQGGLVIWGAPVGNKAVGETEKTFMGALSPSEFCYEKDRFINKVTDLITPSPMNIQFHPLSKNGKYIYLIEVEKSAYSPHQFKDRYYMRIDGQTKPAPHHFIEALFKKITFPKLEGYIKLDSIRVINGEYVLKIVFLIFNQSKMQHEDDLYYRVMISNGIFTDIESNTTENRKYSHNGHEMVVTAAKSTLYYAEPLKYSTTILLKKSSLLESNFECKIVFIFGGKKSPLLRSAYTISLKNIREEDLNSLFLEIDENKYFHESIAPNGKTDAENIRNIIDR